MIALLLLGGAGTRLWPLSTPARPKQFLRLFANRSLFQLTVARLRAAACEHIVVIANAAHAGQVAADLSELGVGPLPLLLEPVRRDSAPAVAAGVAYARARWGPQATIAVIPADHLIPDEQAFAAALRQAAEVAQSGWLVTFGVPPTFAATTYGYLQRGEPVAQHPGAFTVARFHEKPDAATAAAYLRAGGYDWNSGIFVFSAETFAREAAALMPDISEAAGRAVAAAAPAALVLEAAAFAAARRTSIDYALFEKSRRVAMVPAKFPWSDIGHWAAVHAALARDADGNAVVGEVRLHDCSGSLVVADGVPVAAAGLRDMVVVASAAGTFAAPLAQAAEVKAMRDQPE